METDPSELFIPKERVEEISDGVYQLKERTNKTDFKNILYACIISLICLLPIPFCCLGLFGFIYAICKNRRIVIFNTKKKSILLGRFSILCPCLCYCAKKKYEFSQVEKIYLLKHPPQTSNYRDEGLILGIVNVEKGDQEKSGKEKKEVIFYRRDNFESTNVQAKKLGDLLKDHLLFEDTDEESEIDTSREV